MGLIGWIVVGLIAGGLARLIVPGRDPIGCLGTMLLGIVGSFVGGALGSLVFEGEFNIRAANSIWGAILGAIVALLILRQVSGGRAGRRR
jgi:uncharacterized membrane protein YeaQ/YmgE (transglycosylase-associated protein family)